MIKDFDAERVELSMPLRQMIPSEAQRISSKFYKPSIEVIFARIYISGVEERRVRIYAISIIESQRGTTIKLTSSLYHL